MTKDTLIEYKNIDWIAYSKIGDLKQNVIEHKKIAQEFGFKYEFRSKHLIPDDLKVWLKQKNIEFIEHNCRNCKSCME